MELQYRLMHRVRLTPWEQPAVPEPLLRLVSGPQALPLGTALDLGCGSGRYAAFLSAHGWHVHGVDVSAAALARARRLTDAVAWHRSGLGDVQMAQLTAQLEGQVSLILDIGCLHGLSDSAREAWATTVRAVASPDAVALVRAAPPVRPRTIGPRGISSQDVASLLPGWRRSACPEPDWYQLRAPSAN